MVITLLDAQSAERSAPLRIKFAGLSQRGDLVPDALDEYQQFFAWLPEGWQAVRLGDIETRTEYLRPAWHGMSAMGSSIWLPLNMKQGSS